MIENHATHAPATRLRCSVHRFDFVVIGVESPNCSETEQRSSSRAATNVIAGIHAAFSPRQLPSGAHHLAPPSVFATSVRKNG